LIGNWYENREAEVSSGAVPKVLALGVDALLSASDHGCYA
jgi:hypothetical protein